MQDVMVGSVVTTVLLVSAMHLGEDPLALPGLLDSLLAIMPVGQREYTSKGREQRRASVVDQEYDFVIVGAGSAGCVLANRLSEVPHWRVLLIEAGGSENFLTDIPILANVLQFTEANWGYKTQPSNSSCLGMDKGQCHWPRGKVMGGSSVLNYMIYTRGNRRDYDHWAALGNEGWGWRGVLPYFKKLEDLSIETFANDTEHRSSGGYMSVSYAPFKTVVADAFVEAGRYLGHPVVDYNGKTQTGVNYLQVSMKDGARWSSSRGYLHPARGRPNLHIVQRSLVTQLMTDPATGAASGVVFLRDGRSHEVRATKEVILSAGTINSAQLLMLSGIGPKEHLAELGIPLVQDLRVGYNLQDHMGPGSLTYLVDDPSVRTFPGGILNTLQTIREYFAWRRGPATTAGGCEAAGFFDLSHPAAADGYPDLELLQVAGSIATSSFLHRNFNVREKLYREYWAPIKEAPTFSVLPIILRPRSQGRIKLRDRDPRHKPLIYPNYFTDPEGYDMAIAIAGIRKMNELLRTPPFRALGARPYAKLFPPCKDLPYDTDTYWECYVRQLSFTIYHHVGTCKMGPDSDPDAVVDPRLRVRGVKNLRVIDASIMPVIPAGHTNVPTYMVAEKGADLIKEDWGQLE